MPPTHSRLYRAGLITQSILYVAGGINHLWHPGPYVRIMPPHYAHPLGLVQLSGLAEIAGGIGLLIPRTRRVSATGIIAMLLVYFDVHIFMAGHIPETLHTRYRPGRSMPDFRYATRPPHLGRHLHPSDPLPGSYRIAVKPGKDSTRSR